MAQEYPDFSDWPMLRFVDRDILDIWRAAWGDDPMNWPLIHGSIVECQLIRSMGRLTEAIENAKREPKHWQPSPEELAKMQEGAD